MIKKAKLFKKDIEVYISKLIASGKIVARFSGRDEWGPRALGNRSILADPRDLKVINKLYHKLYISTLKPISLALLPPHSQNSTHLF